MGTVISITSAVTYRTRRTPEELDEEISLLAKLRGIIPARSWFGADNHAAIDAQIRVLRERLSREDVEEIWDRDGVNLYVFCSVLDAADWLNGDEFAPSEEWLGMVEDEERVH